MNLVNPTYLRIGQKGILNGVEYHVVGRMVMSVIDAGQVYYWNEFNLLAGSGGVATLVYEETLRGGEWRFFTMFDPENPMSMEEATGKTLGSRVNLDGENVRVTFTGVSRVCGLEGITPEGETRGKEEHYFNAESDSKMVVASWTPQQMEFYHGYTLSPGVVERAFQIPKAPLSDYAKARFRDADGEGNGQNRIQLAVLGFILIAGLLIIFKGLSSNHGFVQQVPAVKVYPAWDSPLKAGYSGQLNGKTWHIQTDYLVEEVEQGLRFNRHEYAFTNDEGDTALLIQGEKPGSKNWWLFTPLHPTEPMTSSHAAALKLGESVNVDGEVAKIEELFRCTSRDADSASWEQNITYGFCGKCGAELLLVRWNEKDISFYRGTSVNGKAVIAAFK